MKTLNGIVLLLVGHAAVAQRDLVGSGYLTPLHKGSAVTFQQVIMPQYGEGQIIGSPHTPGKLLQLIAYTGSWKTEGAKGRVGVYVEHLTEEDRIASVGAYTVFSCHVLGGKLAGPHYFGFKPAGGPWELNTPNSRLVWPVGQETAAGLGWAFNARSGKVATFQMGPVVEWKHRDICARARLGQMFTGPLAGSTQLRVEVFHAF